MTADAAIAACAARAALGSFASFAFFAFLVPGAAWAQEQEPPSQAQEASPRPSSDAGVAPAEPAPAALELAPVEVRATRDPSASTEAPQAKRALDEPAFVTVTSLDDAHHEASPVGEVVAHSVGVNVQTFGGLGAFTSVSVRGAPSGETTILVDGVPLSRVAFSAIDLGSFELGTFDGLEVYRGSVPVELGGAALGGAVNFTTAIGPGPGHRPMTLVLAGGSYGARQARVVRRDRTGDGRVATTLSLGYAGATGDFRYFDDGGTPLNRGDDGEQTRVHNRYDQLDGVARARWRRGDGLTLEGGARLSYKAQELPGTAGATPRRPELTTQRAVADARLVRTRALGSDALDLGGAANLVVETQRFEDPEGEISPHREDRDYLTVATGGTATAGWRATPHQHLGASLEPRFEWFRDSNRVTRATAARGVRWGAALALSDTISLLDDRWLLIPALRADLLLLRPGGGTGDQVTGMDAPPERNDLEPSPRLSTRWRFAPGFALKSSLGRYYREPTLVELYGNHGAIVGNPTLVAETGVSGDLGLVYAPAHAEGALDRVFVEAAAFGSRPRNLIGWSPTSLMVLVASNLGNARLLGAELSASARFFRALTLSANYTLLDARQEGGSSDGKTLPGRPRHNLYLRVDGEHVVAGWRLRAHADLALDSGNYTEVGNYRLLPQRRFVGAGVRVDAPTGGLGLALEGRNLFDERVGTVTPPGGGASWPQAIADVVGYPLPGRSLMLTASADF